MTESYCISNEGHEVNGGS